MTATLEAIAVQIRTGRHDEARRALDAVKPTNEIRNEVTFLRGYLQELSYDREGAAKTYQAWLAQDPEHCEAAFRAAVMCDLVGDEESAEQYLKYKDDYTKAKGDTSSKRLEKWKANLDKKDTKDFEEFVALRDQYVARNQIPDSDAFALFRRPVGDDLQPVWPEKWPRAALAARRREIGEVAFARGYRLACVADDEVPINKNMASGRWATSCTSSSRWRCRPP